LCQCALTYCYLQGVDEATQVHNAHLTAQFRFVIFM
jgi:hypothetical protein